MTEKIKSIIKKFKSQKKQLGPLCAANRCFNEVKRQLKKDNPGFSCKVEVIAVSILIQDDMEFSVEHNGLYRYFVPIRWGDWPERANSPIPKAPPNHPSCRCNLTLTKEKKGKKRRKMKKTEISKIKSSDDLIGASVYVYRTSNVVEPNELGEAIVLKRSGDGPVYEVMFKDTGNIEMIPARFFRLNLDTRTTSDEEFFNIESPDTKETDNQPLSKKNTPKKINRGRLPIVFKKQAEYFYKTAKSGEKRYFSQSPAKTPAHFFKNIYLKVVFFFCNIYRKITNFFKKIFKNT